MNKAYKPNFHHKGKRYYANSIETITLYCAKTIDMDFMEDDFYRILNNKAVYSDFVTILTDSIGGVVDFKLDLEAENNAELYMINGVVYNRNEAGNFMWSYPLFI